MSRFRGPQGKGALRRHREQVRARARRRATIAQHARLWPNRSPVHCTPTRAEKAGIVPRVNSPGNDGKVIYDTLEDAVACARALEVAGMDRMAAYQCKRGSRGHHHLTHDLPATHGRGRSRLDKA